MNHLTTDVAKMIDSEIDYWFQPRSHQGETNFFPLVKTSHIKKNPLQVKSICFHKSNPETQLTTPPSPPGILHTNRKPEWKNRWREWRKSKADPHLAMMLSKKPICMRKKMMWRKCFTCYRKQEKHYWQLESQQATFPEAICPRTFSTQLYNFVWYRIQDTGYFIISFW